MKKNILIFSTLIVFLGVLTFIVLTNINFQNKASKVDSIKNDYSMAPYLNKIDNNSKVIVSLDHLKPFNPETFLYIPEVMSMNRCIRISNVDMEIGVHYLRSINHGLYYSVQPLKNYDGKVAYGFFLYGKNGDLDASWVVEKLPKKSNFESIKIGKTTMNDIKKIDPGLIQDCGLIMPNSQYPNGMQTDASSYHRLSDGTRAAIYYKKMNNSLVVCNITFQKDPVDFVHKLLPQDLALIQ
ncbi:MAG: hypothetical protein Q8876_01440 [Bacillota bacterium]|nr:hypothetical protein [Bacillota bacterium]